MVPAWFISALAFLAAAFLWQVRPMPWRIRFSLAIPLVYFSGLYLWVQFSPVTSLLRQDIIRAGLAWIFLAIIANALVVRFQWWREKKSK